MAIERIVERNNKYIERLTAKNVNVEVTELGDPSYLILRIDDKMFRIAASYGADVAMEHAPELQESPVATI
jgi:hypothetical protein